MRGLALDLPSGWCRLTLYAARLSQLPPEGNDCVQLLGHQMNWQRVQHEGLDVRKRTRCHVMIASRDC